MSRKQYLYKKGKALQAAHLENTLGAIEALKKRALTWWTHAKNKHKPEQQDQWLAELKHLANLECQTYAALLKIQIPKEKTRCL